MPSFMIALALDTFDHCVLAIPYVMPFTTSSKPWVEFALIGHMHNHEAFCGMGEVVYVAIVGDEFICCLRVIHTDDNGVMLHFFRGLFVLQSSGTTLEMTSLCRPFVTSRNLVTLGSVRSSSSIGIPTTP